MKITKFVQSCLLVETPDRVVLFDPGTMSTPTIELDAIDSLDDLFITHLHPDHFDPDFIKRLTTKFPHLRITTTQEVVDELAKQSIAASTQPPEGVEFFDSPHEDVAPVFPQPEEIGIHYLDKLSHPGDSHSFTETKTILALPITAPWGSSIKAVNLALEHKPQYVIPIHDWHWSDEARTSTYDNYEKLLGEEGITFIKPVNGEPFEIDV